MEKKVVVKRDAENPEPVEIIAKSIIELSQGVKKILSGRLNREALLVLIYAACPKSPSSFHGKAITKKQVGQVLDTLKELEEIYIKEIKKV